MSVESFFGKYWVFFLLGAILVFMLFSVFHHNDKLFDELHDAIIVDSLDTLSCEIILEGKEALRKKHYFQNTDEIEFHIKIRWNDMNCNNESSEYWRGESWAPQTPIQQKIQEFNQE
jgi:hypothetical protein